MPAIADGLRQKDLAEPNILSKRRLRRSLRLVSSTKPINILPWLEKRTVEFRPTAAAVLPPVHSPYKCLDHFATGLYLVRLRERELGFSSEDRIDPIQPSLEHCEDGASANLA